MNPETPEPFGPYPERLPRRVRDLLPEPATLTAFCRRWKIHDMALYGAALESGAPPETPFDAVIGFWRPGQWVLDDLVRLESEMCELLGREVHVIERAAVDTSNNPVLRQRIFRSIKTIYLER